MNTSNAIKSAFTLLAVAVCMSLAYSYADTQIKLRNSVKIVLKEVFGGGDHQIEDERIDGMFLEASGSWSVLLDQDFDAAKADLGSLGLRDGEHSNAPTDTVIAHLRRTFGSTLDGYECFYSGDLSLGEGTVCGPRTIKKCSVSLCVKTGNRTLFVVIELF